MNSILWLVLYMLDLYFWIIIISVVMSWLVGFNVINPQNGFVRQVGYFLHRLTEPVLGPIRRLLPDLGGLDVSPMVVLIAIMFLKRFIVEMSVKLL